MTLLTLLRTLSTGYVRKHQTRSVLIVLSIALGVATLVGTQALSAQLSGIVRDNQGQLDPALRALDQVTAMLRRNQGSLDHALAVAGPYYRLIGNTLGNGRWFDSYLCGIIPRDYLPPGTPPATGCMPPKQQAKQQAGQQAGRSATQQAGQQVTQQAGRRAGQQDGAK